MKELRHKLKENGVQVFDTDAFIAFMLRNDAKKNYCFLESFEKSLSANGLTGFVALIPKLEKIIEMIILSRGIQEVKSFNYHALDQCIKDKKSNGYAVVKRLIDNQRELLTIKDLIKNVLGLEDEQKKGLMSKSMYEVYLDYVAIRLPMMRPICTYLKKARHICIHSGGIVKEGDFDRLDKINIAMFKMLVCFYRVPNGSKWRRFVNGIRNRCFIWKVKTLLVRDSISTCWNNGVTILGDTVDLVWSICKLIYSFLLTGVKYAMTIVIALCMLACFSEMRQKHRNFEDVTMMELLNGSFAEKDRLYMERVELANGLKSDSKLESIHQRTGVLNKLAKEKREIPNWLIRFFPMMNQFDWVGEYRRSYLGSLLNADLQSRPYTQAKLEKTSKTEKGKKKVADGKNKGKSKVNKPIKPMKSSVKTRVEKPIRKTVTKEVHVPTEDNYIKTSNPYSHYTENLYFESQSSAIKDANAFMELAVEIKKKTHPKCILEIECGVSGVERSGKWLWEARIGNVISCLRKAGVKNRMIASSHNSADNKIGINMYVPKNF